MSQKVLSDSNNKVKILVVDDEPTLCDVLEFNLGLEGYEVDTARSAEEALTLDLSQYSLVLLDIMMGEISGTQMARIMKQSPHTASIPIIFCTAKDSEEDMVNGLDLGADDYIMKPYSIRNVIARVNSVLRRTLTNTALKEDNNSCHVFKGLCLDPETKRCTVDGSDVRLPRTEFEILALLMSHRGRLFSREEILTRIWPDEVTVADRVVDVNITRLRSKIGPYGKLIVTRSGYGYGFQI